MSHRFVVACALGAGLLGCTSSSSDGGISSLFEALNGEYTLVHRADCVIEVLGSRVRTLNSKGARLCKEEDEDGDIESLNVDATMSDQRMSGTFDYYERYDTGEINLPSTPPGCTLSNEKRVEISLDAKKERGRERAGRFSGLAGVWTGTLTVKETKNRHDSCKGAFETVVVNETYTVGADISGDFATITYQLTSGKSSDPSEPAWPSEDYYPALDTSGTIDVREDASGQLRLDGSLVEVR